ncbi:hypothetical protein [Escherichia sp. E13S3]|uniref:hypothetical protein n=1 Tax=Escherichia sp. E13S3 TaxID=2484854 RepID=UPI00102A1C00|nr:hypothetical protein [Escherichia sp. E13S3]
MRWAIFFLFLVSFLSWGGCVEINSSAERYQSLNVTSESNYVVTGGSRIYFYNAPDENCKIKDVFIIKGDVVSVYAEYKNFSSVMFFRKNGDPISGWVHSGAIEPTGTGVGPK